MNKTKPRILLIYPGPNYTPEDTFDERLGELSNHYEGTLITTAPSAKCVSLHDFTVQVVSRKAGRLATMARLIYSLFVAIRKSGRGKLDLVVTYDPLRSGMLGLVAKYMTGARLIVEVNGDYDDPANYQDVRIKYLRGLKRKIYVAVERMVLKRADGIKLLYQDQIERLNLDCSGKTVAVFANRVLTDKFTVSNPGQYILSVGFPWQVKGVDISIKAFRKVSVDYPDWSLKIVGWFQDSLPLEELIDGHPKIELLPPVKHSSMPELIGNCGIFVLASRTESMGRVLIEAMAAGKPRIGTRVGGIPSVIADEVDGLLVEPESADELAVAMGRLMENDDLRERLGNSARQRAISMFSKKNYYDDLTGFYGRVLS